MTQPIDYATGPDPKEAVKVPAILLYVTAGLGLLTALFGILNNVLGLGIGATQGGRDGSLNMMMGGAGLVFNVIGILVCAFIAYGAYKLMNLQSYGLVMAAIIVAMVPCVSPCCLVGLPVGIWALVVIMKPEIKAAFV